MGSPGGVSGYTAFGADFDGTNDFLARGGGLTGVSDGKTGLFSVWFRKDGGDSAFREICSASTLKFRQYILNTNVLKIEGRNAANTLIFDITTTGTFLTSASYVHILASWDLGTAGRRHIFVGDVEDTNQNTFTDDDIDYTAADWGIGGLPSGSNKFNGCLSEMYFALEWLDITVEANRRKFSTAAGKPVDLGADGSLPTGTAAIIYEPFEDLDGTNKGTGGNFNVTGELVRCSSSPSD